MAGEDEHETLVRNTVADEGDGDSPANVRGIARVLSVQSVLVPMFREPVEPPPPKPKGEPAVRLQTVNWSPAPRKAQMATMSDLGKNGTRGGTPTVARNPKPDPDADKPKN